MSKACLMRPGGCNANRKNDECIYTTLAQSVVISVNLPPKIHAYLEQAVEEGMYGASVEEAAERFICRQIQQLISDGIIDRVRIGTEEERRA